MVAHIDLNRHIAMLVKLALQVLDKLGKCHGWYSVVGWYGLIYTQVHTMQ
jgi:hypothetical protein